MKQKTGDSTTLSLRRTCKPSKKQNEKITPPWRRSPRGAASHTKNPAPSSVPGGTPYRLHRLSCVGGPYRRQAQPRSRFHRMRARQGSAPGSRHLDHPARVAGPGPPWQRSEGRDEEAEGRRSRRVGASRSSKCIGRREEEREGCGLFIIHRVRL